MRKHKIAIFMVASIIVFSGIALALANTNAANNANAGTIENLQRQISAAQQEMADLLPLLDNSGGTPEENAAIKSDINAINNQAGNPNSQWENIKSSQNQNGWQEQMIKKMQQTVETIKSTLGLI